MWPRRRRGERGVVAVEAALVVPVLLILVFGMIEFAFVLRDWANVSANVRSGARIASTLAGGGPGTCETGASAPPCTSTSSPALAQAAADAIQRASSAMPKAYVDYILVYKANNAGLPGALTAMPTSCDGVSNCVKFVWRSDLNAFRFSAGSWNSQNISACFPGNATNPQERVGVLLHASHPMMTGLFGAKVGLSDSAVMDFEPLPTVSCNGKGPANGGHL